MVDLIVRIGHDPIILHLDRPNHWPTHCFAERIGERVPAAVTRCICNTKGVLLIPGSWVRVRFPTGSKAFHAGLHDVKVVLSGILVSNFWVVAPAVWETRRVERMHQLYAVFIGNVLSQGSPQRMTSNGEFCVWV